MTIDLLSEVEKMRRVPGIVFADSPVHGRVARIAGTGLDVFEVIGEYRWNGESVDLLRAAFHWLRDDQLQAALAYAREYPDEINALVDRLESFSLEDAWKKHPFMKPVS